MDILFVYEKKNEVKVLTHEESLKQHKGLIEKGFNHKSTINPAIVLQEIYSQKNKAINIKTINAEWLNKKIDLYYGGNKKAFANDKRNAFKYSMITKHATGERIAERFKNHYFLFFLCLDNGLI